MVRRYACLALLALVGCGAPPGDGDDAGPQDAGVDAGVDGGADAGRDAGPDAGGPDGGPFDGGTGDGGDPGFPWVPAPDFDPGATPLCDIPVDYVASGGDPVNPPCEVAAGRFTDRDPSVVPTWLKIVAWNVHLGQEAAAVKTALETHPDLAGADVLLLSEVPRNELKSNPPSIDLTRDLAQLLAMDYVFAVEFDRRLIPDSLGELGNAVLSKYPIGNVTQIRHVEQHDGNGWYTDADRYGGRMTLGATLKVGSGWVRVYATHLEVRLASGDLTGTGRAAQAAEIRADADLPERASVQVVGGDLNTYLCVSFLSDCTKPPQAEPTIQDFVTAGWSDATQGWDGFTALGGHLDWIFYRGAPGVTGAAVNPNGSDHWAIQFELSPP